MRSLQNIRANTAKSAALTGQPQHVMLVILLAWGAVSMLRYSPGSPSFLGFDAIDWALLTILVVIIHQVIVAIVFRSQLHFAVMTRLLGANALKIWGAIFMPFLIARPLLVLATGIADYNSLDGSQSLRIIGGILLLAVAVWGAHSVAKYFGINRALGGDHFYDEYANMPLVNEGAFKYTSNAMYGVVFLGLWGIALLTGSWNALVLALFQHAYIWVHMYCTEDPDMKVIYA